MVAILMPLFFGLGEPASAATNCRKVMRDLQVQVIGAKSNVNSTPTAEELTKMQQLIAAKAVAYPECKSEFVTWFQWNQELNPSTPFPFGEAGDPRTYPLGPISWWWDKVYIDLFGQNLILMFLFGWEIFLGGLWAVIAIPLAILGALIPALGHMVSMPFRLLRRRSKSLKLSELPQDKAELEEVKAPTVEEVKAPTVEEVKASWVEDKDSPWVF